MQKVILSLVGLNLALVAYLAFALTQRASPQKVSVPDSSAPVSALARDVASSRVPRPAKTGFTPQSATWASLASADLRRYAANLRRVGCPEQTIKEIMLAEVNRRSAPQERALKVRPDDVAPWETAGTSDRRNNEAKLRQLLEEKRTLLKDLTGVDTGIDMPSRLAGRDVEKFEGGFNALPDSKRSQARAIQENYWAQSDEIKQRTLGYLEPEDRDEFLRIKTERREALAQVLSPRELQDFELQTSETATALRSRFDKFDVTDEEFRKVFDFMQPLDEKYSLTRRNPDPENQEFTGARTQAEKDVQDQIHSALGDERYAEYQRTRDPVYRTISQAGTEAGVPKDSILVAYQAQQQMQDESRRILQDPNLTQEQRVQSLNDMRAEAQQKLQQIFGDKAGAVLQRLPGQLNDRYGLGNSIQGTPGVRVQNVVSPIPP